MASRPCLQPASIPLWTMALRSATVWYVDSVLISVVLSSILTRSMRSRATWPRSGKPRNSNVQMILDVRLEHFLERRLDHRHSLDVL
jgi:hypothetical protein